MIATRRPRIPRERSRRSRERPRRQARASDRARRSGLQRSPRWALLLPPLLWAAAGPPSARSAHRQYDFERAASLHREAVEFAVRTWGESSQEVTAPLNDLALLEHELGDYDSALVHHERVAAILESVPGAPALRLAASLNHRADLLRDMGDLRGARSLLERSLAVCRTHGLDSLRAQLLLPLASVLAELGDEAASSRCVKVGLELVDRIWAGDSVMTMFYRLNHGMVALQSDRLEEARARFEEFLAWMERTARPEERSALAFPLTLLGIIDAQTGRLDAGQARLERALGLQRERGSPGARAYECMAMIFGQREDVETTLAYMDTAVRRVEESLGPRHREFMRMLLTQGRLLLTANGAKGSSRIGRPGEVERAFDAVERADAHRQAQIVRIVHSLPDRQAIELIEEWPSGLGFLVQAAAFKPSPDWVARAWAAVIRSRTMVLDAVAERRRLERLAGDAEVAGARAARQRASRRLADLMVRGPEDLSPQDHRRRVDQAIEECEALERDLARRSAAFRSLQQRGEVGLVEVLAALPPGAGLVAYARSGDPAEAGSGDYLAFVASSGERAPRLVPIGSSSEVESLVGAWRREAAAPPLDTSNRGREAACRAVGSALRAMIWDPILRHLPEASEVYVVPDGALHLVSIAALPAPGGRFVVETGPLIRCISAERDLLPRADRAPRGAGILLVGGPHYDAAETPAAGGISGRRAAADDRVVASRFRGRRSTCRSFRSIRWEALPGTLEECRQIAELWRPSAVAEAPAPANDDVLLVTGSAAGEAAFKSLSSGRRVIHIATHGFFLGSECVSPAPSRRGIGRLASLEDARVDRPSHRLDGENPLILSGLILAGANRSGKHDRGDEDGFLTAEEIAALDLSGVELAVLSACETGVGEVRSGQGVFGLQRAFRVAGVGGLVMSLWSVEDSSTRQWMRAFYSARHQNPDAARAAREAALQMLRSRRRDRLSTHPFHWGGFICMGS